MSIVIKGDLSEILKRLKDEVEKNHPSLANQVVNLGKAASDSLPKIEIRIEEGVKKPARAKVKAKPKPKKKEEEVKPSESEPEKSASSEPGADGGKDGAKLQRVSTSGRKKSTGSRRRSKQSDS